MNDLFAALSWLLVVELLGLAALPLALRWLRWLPDRGYFFAKPLAVLVVSYVVWLGASLGALDNSSAGAIFIAIGLAVACWLWAGGDARQFWRSRRSLILGSELLFAAAFALWTYVRAHDPAIAATEKPMEIAFLSATMRSAQFPPIDPWLSGFGISYYYFGYVMVNVLAKLAGVTATVAFNLAIALLFALTVGGAFSLGYNIAAKMSSAIRESGKVASGLLASLLVAIAGNLEVFVELLNARGLLSPAAWRWVQIKDLPPPSGSPSWLPVVNWWWFRATRVVGDFDPLTNSSRDYTINEFPFFSFLLGDLHPHVLALPFALLAIAVALNLFYDGREWSAGALRQRRLEWLLFGLIFGGLGFLNSWDMPAYLLLLVLAFGARRYQRDRKVDPALLKEILGFGGLVLVTGILLYLPFYLGFHSQASGLGLVAVRTKLRHLALFWAPLLSIALVWLIGSPRWRATGQNETQPRETCRAQHAGVGFRARATLTSALGAVAVVILVVAEAQVAALLLILLAMAGYSLFRHLRRDDVELPGAGFVGLLVLCAIFLIFVCEWLFIRDYFNNRMNTVFKLYYQGWLMLAVAGGPVLYYFAIRRVRSHYALSRRLAGLLWRTAAIVLLLASLVYPVTATWAKTDRFSARATLDGMAFLDRFQPGDAAAIRWLRQYVAGAPVILEATGGSYGPAGRVSAFTGLPTLLGWDFHEQQWRGSYDQQRVRKGDVDSIYAGDRVAAERLLRKYNVSYVYIGQLERDTYGKFGPAVLDKFAGFMDVAYRNSDVVIYRMRG